MPRTGLLVVGVFLLVLLAVPAWALRGGRRAGAGVPNLGGRSAEDARAELSNLGLSLELVQQPTQDTPAGVVVAQDPPPSTRVAAPSTVRAVVSSGVTVPDLGGRQCTEARADLAQRGWSVRPVRWRVANVEDFGKVVAQEPAPGTVLPAKGEIAVHIGGPVRPC